MEVIEIYIGINRLMQAVKITEVAKSQYAKFQYATYEFGDL